VRLYYDVPVIAGGQFVTVSRMGPSGQSTYVRGWIDQASATGQIVIRDFEAPIGVPIAYTAQTADSAGVVADTQTATITIPSGPCENTWLNDLARVGNTMQVLMESLPELNYPVPASVHDVITRRDPIVTSDIAHTPSFELAFITDSDDERQRARAILGNGAPVLLRTPPENGVGNMYFSVLGFQEQRVVTPARVVDRRFLVSGRQVARPDPLLYKPVGFVDYAYVRGTFATYQTLKDDRVSYDAMLYDWSGQAPQDVVPWPPSDL
jgi:hypothetical protein